MQNEQQIFKLHAPYQPTGDQPQAIEELVRGFKEGNQFETLLGVTGSGKTFTMAKIIEKVQRPTLVLAHNKTLAAQLCAEFREFFPNNAVEYFVSYYDYYQPEAYIPHTDTFIEKDSAINEEIDRLRLSATASLLERRDVIVVSSVSCIYGLGEPEDFEKMMVSLRVGAQIERDELLKKLVAIRYERNDIAFERNMFRVRGDTVEVWPAYWKDTAIRVEFFGDEIDRISEINVVTASPIRRLNNIPIWPATHYVTPKEKMDAAVQEIYRELEERVAFFEGEGKLIEAQRVKQRTMYDVEMMQELGYCSGIENYSRIISDRPAGSAPMTLLDFFPDDFLLFVDESHVTLPQVRAMYNGDHARKDSLVKYGFRLPCAYDNRPLKFEEFEERIGQAVFVSATPGPYERERADQVVEQVIRPTGLLDPRVEVRPVTGQIDDLMDEIRARAARDERVLVTTLTKRMAEDLTDHMKGLGLRVRYMHSDVAAIQRMEIIRDMRLDVFDVLVGINLLREGLDLPEVSLVAVLDADITGPSIPKTFGIHGRAVATEDAILPVITGTGIQLMSVNLLLEHETDPVIWRGPVIGGVVQQFWGDVLWQDVDYMFVDMPPGTGDVPLTVFQSLPVDGIIVVTSPQDLVSMIVTKAVHMAQMMSIPVLGLIETYSYYQCPDCGAKHAIFGESHLEQEAMQLGLPLLARLPIDPELAAAIDVGKAESLPVNYLEGVAEQLDV